jgi:hypothetical protein
MKNRLVKIAGRQVCIEKPVFEFDFFFIKIALMLSYFGEHVDWKHKKYQQAKATKQC